MQTRPNFFTIDDMRITRVWGAHWQSYFGEATELGFFMINAWIMTTLLRYAGSFLHQFVSSEFVQRLILGTVIFLIVMIIIYNSWNKVSRAFINPAIILASIQLGRISKIDAEFACFLQFLVTRVLAFATSIVIGRSFQHFNIRYATTRPDPDGLFGAFIATFLMSHRLMLALLWIEDFKRLKPYLGLIVAFIISVYLPFETPLFGVSSDSARSFESALVGNITGYFWIYLTALLLGTFVAAETYLNFKIHPSPS
ncbi:MAG: aquaporin [Chitinophagaceae bacterium]|nr:aquaporin [Oligoflexus sp.]